MSYNTSTFLRAAIGVARGAVGTGAPPERRKNFGGVIYRHKL